MRRIRRKRANKNEEKKLSAGQRWERLSRTVAKVEQETFIKIPRKWAHNENHESLYRELVDIRLVGRCKLEGLEWFLKNGASVICIVKFILDIIKSNKRIKAGDGQAMEKNHSMIMTKRGGIRERHMKLAILKMWMTAAKKVRKEKQMNKEASNDKKEKKTRQAQEMEKQRQPITPLESGR